MITLSRKKHKKTYNKKGITWLRYVKYGDNNRCVYVDFGVITEWLADYIKNEYESVNEFVEYSTNNEIKSIYIIAKLKNKLVIKSSTDNN